MKEQKHDEDAERVTVSFQKLSPRFADSEANSWRFFSNLSGLVSSLQITERHQRIRCALKKVNSFQISHIMSINLM